MRRGLFVLSISLLGTQWVGALHNDFQSHARAAQQLKQQVESAPPAQQQEIKKQIAAHLNQMETLADQERTNPRSQTKAAAVFLQTDEPQRALRRADLATQLAPDDPQARTVHAQANYALGQFAQAAEDAKIALKLEPGNQAAMAVLRLSDGRAGPGDAPPAAQTQQGRDGAATAGILGGESAADAAKRRQMLAAGARTADRAKVDELLGQAAAKLKLGDRAAAGGLLDKAAALDGNDGRVHALRAMALLPPAPGDAKAAQAALAEARQAVTLAPNDPSARLALARALEANGASADEVLAAYQAAAQLDPSLQAAYQEALQRRGGPQAAAAGAAAKDAAARAQTQDGGIAADLLAGRLPEAARKGWPWLSVAAAVAFLAWTLLTRRQVS